MQGREGTSAGTSAGACIPGDCAGVLVLEGRRVRVPGSGVWLEKRNGNSRVSAEEAETGWEGKLCLEPAPRVWEGDTWRGGVHALGALSCLVLERLWDLGTSKVTLIPLPALINP